ncbi:hypothetical protein QEZ54_00565 [Catellatospora sp. KI3]|uniref:hypothetical protein n=1 Tax=Catellatospora sp. KI3 TaxID=3041620 RepID=UPI002482F2DB|nr:hypothetical protein [Catellatospora sp. KI3]MDI1459450.1 hypothetical protein [Catellatospora sp. KI3]
MTERVLADVSALPYGELAVALCHSPMPDSGLRVHDISAQQIAQWAMQGVARLGGVKPVETLAQRSRELGIRRARRLADADELREYAAMWPSSRRTNMACGLAYHLVRLRLG